MTHTPGPWTIGVRSNTYQAVGDSEKLVAVGLPVQFVALSVGTPQGQVAIVPLDESSRENAHLIAAAPALLAALKGLMNDLDDDWWVESTPHDKALFEAAWDGLHQAEWTAPTGAKETTP